MVVRGLVPALLTAALTLAVTPGAPAASGAGPSGASTGGAGLRVVSHNLLHGTFCDDRAGCRAPDRVALFLRQLEDARCPEIVGLQEINNDLRRIFTEQLPDVCGERYRMVFTEAEANDAELVLTTLETRKARIVDLPGPLRTASRVEIDTPVGPVVLVVTHQDGDRPFPACRDDVERYRCPKPCPAGTTFSECQTIVGLRLAQKGGGRRAVRIYMGDFNIPPGSPRYERIVDAGFVDAHVAAGNPECDPATGAQCTAGRGEQHLATLMDPAARQQERIDFVFVAVGPGCAAAFDPADDADGDGVGTGLFAAEPAVGGPGGLVWPSDHTAVSMDMTCTSR